MDIGLVNGAYNPVVHQQELSWKDTRLLRNQMSFIIIYGDSRNDYRPLLKELCG